MLQVYVTGNLPLGFLDFRNKLFRNWANYALTEMQRYNLEMTSNWEDQFAFWHDKEHQDKPFGGGQH